MPCGTQSPGIGSSIGTSAASCIQDHCIARQAASTESLGAQAVLVFQEPARFLRRDQQATVSVLVGLDAVLTTSHHQVAHVC